MKCFYHNDLDGRSAGSLVAQYEKNHNKEDFFEVNYTSELPLKGITAGEKVYFVDYSFSESTYPVLKKLLFETKADVVWIDHHASSIELIENHPELYLVDGIRSADYSGAMLVYIYFFLSKENWGNTELIEKEVPYYIKLVSDYDTWQNKLPASTYFKCGIETMDYDALDDIWDSLASDVRAVNGIISTGMIIKNYIDMDNAYYRNHFAYESEICGHKCLVVNKKTNSWIFGGKMKDYPCVVVFVFNGEKYEYSVYSDNGVDCEKIAKTYGGGGHKGAAGFCSTELLFKKC